MMTPRERLRICFMFAGIVCALCGTVVSCAEPPKELKLSHHRVGAWRDSNFVGAVPKEVAPWLIMGGVLMLVSSFFSND